MNFSADIKTAGPAAKLAGVARIIYRRGSAIPIKNSLLNRFLFKRVLTDIIANSEATKKQYFRTTQIYSTKKESG